MRNNRELSFGSCFEIKTARPTVPAIPNINIQKVNTEPKKELEEGQVEGPNEDSTEDSNEDPTENNAESPKQEQKMIPEQKGKQISLQYMGQTHKVVYTDIKKRLPKNPGLVRQRQVVISEHHKIILATPSKYYCKKKPENEKVVYLHEFYKFYCVEAKRAGAVELTLASFKREIQKLFWCVKGENNVEYVFPFQRITTK